MKEDIYKIEENGLCSVQEQKDLVKSCMEEALEIGQTWYVIDYKWFESWKDYTNYSDSASNKDKHSPGPIDNFLLLTDDGGLKEQVVENVDFGVVPERVWKMLVKCYGTITDQKALACPVIEMGLFNKMTKVELYPLQLLLAHYKHPTSGKPVKCSHAMTVGELKEKMRKMYEIAEEAQVKLLSSYMSSDYNELDNDSDTLERANLQPRQFVVIVEKDGANWPQPDMYKQASASCFTAPTTVNNSVSSAAVPLASTVKSTNSCNSYGSTSGSSSNGGISSTSSYTNGTLSSSYFNSNGSYDKGDSPGLCGLRNLGNTCFMNSSLQCLSNVPALTTFFTSDSWKKDLNTKNPLGMRGEIADSYAALMKSMWSGHNSSCAPKNFKGAVGRFAPRFSGYQQQDSHELMAFLLDGLHEDLNRIKKKPYVEIKSTDGKSDEEAAEQAWSDYLKRNDSIIIDLFHGQLKSTVRCPQCKNESKTFDPFCYLSLPIPAKNSKRLRVHFVSCDKRKLPIKCRVKVPHDGVFADLFEGVAEMFNTSATQLVAAELHRNRFQKIYQSSSSLRNIRDSDQIFVYELRDSCEDHVPVILYFKEMDSTRYQVPGTIAWPAIINVPKDVTFDELYDTINLHQTIIDEKDVNIHLSNNHNADIDERERKQKDVIGEEKLDKDKDVDTDKEVAVGEPMEVCTSPKVMEQRIFQLHLITQYGSRMHHDLPLTGPVSLQPLSYLSIEFDKDLIGKSNTTSSFDVEEHVSLQEHLSESGVTLEDCVELFASEEQLSEHDTWYCPVCKDHVQAFKQFALWKLPKYLVIQLKRYKSSMSSYSYYRDKVDTLVKYPLRDLDLTPKVIGRQKEEKCLYDLLAVSNHYGGLGGGHYTAYAKNPQLDKWYYFDDSSVSSASESSVVNRSGYLLVYERRGF